MKKFAAHYLYFQGYGFLKQYVVEITSSGEINRIFPLIHEMASVEWHPGVIVISFSAAVNAVTFEDSDLLSGVPVNYFTEFSGKKTSLFRAYPFDFAEMKPLSGTKIILLN